MKTIFIMESGMKFGPYPEDKCFHYVATDKNRGFITLSKPPGSLIIKVTENDGLDKFANHSSIDEEPRSISATLVELILTLLLKKTSQAFFLPSSRLVYLAFYQYFYRFEKEKKQEMSKRLVELLELKYHRTNPFISTIRCTP